MPIACTRSSTERVEMPWMYASWMTAVRAPELVEGLRHPPGFQKTREVRALAQLRDAQLDVAGPRLPVPVTVAIALGQSLERPFAMDSAGQPLNFQLHQPLSGKADHVTKHIGIGVLLKQRTKRHHLIGHRGHLR